MYAEQRWEEKQKNKMPEKEDKPKTGDILNFTKEVDTFVVGEEDNQIPCESPAMAKILSLLFEIKEKSNKAKEE